MRDRIRMGIIMGSYMAMEDMLGRIGIRMITDRITEAMGVLVVEIIGQIIDSTIMEGALTTEMIVALTVMVAAVTALNKVLAPATTARVRATWLEIVPNLKKREDLMVREVGDLEAITVVGGQMEVLITAAEEGGNGYN